MSKKCGNRRSSTLQIQPELRGRQAAAWRKDGRPYPNRYNPFQLAWSHLSLTVGSQAEEGPGSAVGLRRFISPPDKLPEIPRPELQIDVLGQRILDRNVRNGTVTDQIVVAVEEADRDPDFSRQTGFTRPTDRAEKVQQNRYRIPGGNVSPFRTGDPADARGTGGLRLLVAMFLSNFFQQSHGSFYPPFELLQLLLLTLQRALLLLQLSLHCLLRQEHDEGKKSRNVHMFLDPSKPGVVHALLFIPHIDLVESTPCNASDMRRLEFGKVARHSTA